MDITAFINKTSLYTFADLREIMTVLRSPGGCPWDREQTHDSIRGNFIEETYEAIEAIDTSDDVLLCEELGDVLLQVVFHAEMAREREKFSMDEVCDGICRKLISRHPHIFGDIKAETSREVLENWNKIKTAEKRRDTPADRASAVPTVFPALMRAAKVLKTAKVDYTHLCEVEEKSAELSRLLEIADKSGEAADNAAVSAAVGELLFAVSAAAAKIGTDAELALTRRIEEYIGELK